MRTHIPSLCASLVGCTSLAALGLISLPPSAAGQGARASGFQEGREILNELSHAHCPYSGKVAAVEPQDATTTHVVIKSVQHWSDNASGEYKGRNVDREFFLVWKRGVSPVPFVVGMDLWFAVDNQGAVTVAQLIGSPVYFRPRPDGLVELLVQYQDREFHRQGYVRIVPDRVNLDSAATICWSRRHGLVVAALDADGGEAEQESSAARRRGLPVANRPGETVQPGRDGWTWSEDLSHEGSKRVVPPQQFIGTAG